MYTKFNEFLLEYNRKTVDDNTLSTLLGNVVYKLEEYKDYIIKTHEVDVNLILNDFNTMFGEEFTHSINIEPKFKKIKRDLSKLDDKQLGERIDKIIDYVKNLTEN